MNSKHKNFYQAALLLFHEKGFKATTMRDIAGKMKCDVANLYNFTNSKLGILEKILFEINELFHEKLDSIIGSKYPVSEKLRSIISIYVQLSYEHPYKLSLLESEWKNLNGKKFDLFLEEKANFELKVRSIIEQGMKNGELKEGDAALTTYLFLANLRLLFSKYTEGSISLNRVDIERQICQYIFHGLLSK